MRMLCKSQALVARLTIPFLSNFLFTNLFSIKILYFFIISSLFPYFNLFVSIFIQSYVNIKLHVLTLYQGLKLRKYFRGQVGPHQINFGSPHKLLGAHQVRIARLTPRLQGALRRGVR